jgi:hypothetical protein
MSTAAWRRSWVAIYEAGGHSYAVRVVYSDESGTGSQEEEPISRQLLRKPEAREYYDLIRPQIVHDALTPLWDVAIPPIVDRLLKM